MYPQPLQVVLPLDKDPIYAPCASKPVVRWSVSEMDKAEDYEVGDLMLLSESSSSSSLCVSLPQGNRLLPLPTLNALKQLLPRKKSLHDPSSLLTELLTKTPLLLNQLLQPSILTNIILAGLNTTQKRKIGLSWSRLRLLPIFLRGHCIRKDSLALNASWDMMDGWWIPTKKCQHSHMSYSSLLFNPQSAQMFQ